MLSVVLGLFNIIINIGYYSIFLSYKTGQVIVNGLIASCDVVNKLFTTLWTVLVILNEDLYVFLRDAWDRLGFIIQAFTTCLDFISDSVVSLVGFCRFLVFGTSDLLITTVQTILGVITKVITTIGSVFSGVKHILVLFGSGVWFAVTLIPVFIVYLWVMSTYYLGRTADEIYAAIHTIYSTTTTGICDLINFVIDVPFESLAGLTACGCLTYVLIKFHIALFSILTRFLTMAKTTISEYILVYIRQIQLRSREIPVSEASSESSDSEEPNVRQRTKRGNKADEEDSRLCIICLERNKCILAMPCRHMCTCIECNDTLRNYQHTCPICRRYVSYTIQVY